VPLVIIMDTLLVAHLPQIRSQPWRAIVSKEMSKAKPFSHIKCMFSN
jgi:hypothetical protein